MFERRSNGLYYNTAPLIGPNGEMIGKYSKTHIPPKPEEKFYFTPGSKFPVFKTEIGNIGILIARAFPRQKALIPESLEAVNVSRAYDNSVHAVFLNRAGKENSMEYFGYSLIISPEGKILARAGLDECVITATVDIGKSNVLEKRRIYANERRSEIYGRIIEPV